MKAGLLMSLLLIVPLTAPVGAQPTVSTAPASSSAEICTELLHLAQDVSRILRTISDRESADKAAGELRKHLETMKMLCLRLENLPIESEAMLRELTTAMRSLTHITQGYFPVVHRLLEVNAYGSEELIQVFNTYRVPTSMRSDEGAAEAQEVYLHLEWGDALEDVVCYLGRIRTAADAESLLPHLGSLVDSVEACRRRATDALDENATHDVLEQLKPAMERCRASFRMIQEERARLKANALLNDRLSELIERTLAE